MRKTNLHQTSTRSRRSKGPTRQQVEMLFARRIEAFNRGDVAALSALYSEDCIAESPIAGTLFGRAAVEQLYHAFLKAFPDSRIEAEELLVVGNHAVETFRLCGTDTGGFLGQSPTGKAYSLRGVRLNTLRNLQIVRERRVYDLSGLMMQLTTDRDTALEATRLYSTALERSRQEQELRIAARIQRALLPDQLCCGSNFRLAATSVPCRAIGGDFFDYLHLSDGAFGVALGDVAGKGAPAALLASKLQGIFVANASHGHGPATTIKQVNDALLRRAIEARFATVFYAVLSSDGLLTYCNAGHNPPILFSGGNTAVRRLHCGGPIVGAFDNAVFVEESVHLQTGDVLVVFSDGVTEALSGEGEEFGEARLISSVRNNQHLEPDALLTCLLDSVHDFVDGVAQSDDVTALVLRHTHRAVPHTA